LKERRALLDAEFARHGVDDLQRLHEQSVETATRARIARLERANVATLLNAEKGSQEQLQTDAAGEADRALLESLRPHGILCNVPLSTARAQGCTLAPQRPTELTAVRRDRATQAAVGVQAEQLESLRDAYQKLDGLCRDADMRARAAQAAYLSANTRRTELLAQQAAKREELESIERDLRLAKETWSTTTTLGESSLILEDEIKASNGRLTYMRNEHAAAVGRVSDCFDLVIQGLLGHGARGNVAADDLSLTVEERGDRASTSLTVVKVLAFDLAAMTASVEGHGTFPRFLVHDGPREADLDPSIYARLFLYARALEEACPWGASFQYIVTTTTAPPEELQMAPWLVDPVLDASTASGRLFGVDL
jgi:hypothetical protein